MDRVSQVERSGHRRDPADRACLGRQVALEWCPGPPVDERPRQPGDRESEGDGGQLRSGRAPVDGTQERVAGGPVVVAAALGLIDSPWGVLALPGAVLIGFAFAGMGVAAITYFRTWQDFEFLTLVQLPMFLFSATFFPISTYPTAIQWIVRFSPLYHAIRLLRALNLGLLGWAQAVDIVYLFVLGLIGVYVAQRRVGKLLLK